MTEDTSFNVMILPGEDDFSDHTSRPENINGYSTVLDSEINYLSHSLALFTRYSTMGSSLFLNTSLGLDFGPSVWRIFHQDLSTPFPDNAQFDLLIPNMDAGVFIHRARSTNIIGNWSVIEHPLTDQNEDAIIFIAQVYNPGGVNPGTSNNHVVGVWYDGANWAVYNQDSASMPSGSAFNVFIPLPGPNVFTHQANPGNSNANLTYLDHPDLNGNPYVSLLLTQNWNPGGIGGVYNDSPVYTAYDTESGRWVIGNERQSPIPEGSSFNVFFKDTPETSFLPLFSR